MIVKTKSFSNLHWLNSVLVRNASLFANLLVRMLVRQAFVVQLGLPIV